MTRNWVAVAAFACLLLAAWLLSSHGGAARYAPGAAPRDSRDQPADPTFADLGRSADRLRSGLSAAPRPASRRNLFAFREAAPVAHAASRAAAVVSSAAPEAHRPPMRLVGIAEDERDGRRVRIALVSTFDQLYFLEEGDRLLARYVVARIGDAAVQFKDGAESFTLALR